MCILCMYVCMYICVVFMLSLYLCIVCVCMHVFFVCVCAHCDIYVATLYISILSMHIRIIAFREKI